ncbi:MAG: hypothetical protein JWN33_197 [Candidatus Saccharibacteria bacterium]|nr:hypothetical protein [Candidatus Saccharibacteria bacterium]
MARKFNHAMQSGFSLTEMVVVLAVLAILMTITYLSYGSITARQGTTQAQTNAIDLRRVVLSYKSDKGVFPDTISNLMNYSGTSKVSDGLTVVAGQAGTSGGFTGTLNISTSNGKTSVAYACYITCTNSTGGRITYWDFITQARSTDVVYVGAATSTGTYVVPAP